MKVLRLKQDADSIHDIEEVEKIIKQRFSKISDQNIGKSFFWGNRVRRAKGKRKVTYSLAVYDTDDNESVYLTLKENLSDIFEEKIL